MRRVALIAILVLVACGTPGSTTSNTASGRQTVVWAVGDLCAPSYTARCAKVGNLISADADTDAVLALGDLQYATGSLYAFRHYYNPQMAGGKGLLSRTYPVPGNHEYKTTGAAGYYDFFGTRAGDRTKGWYAFTLNGWRLIATNSNCAQVGGCGSGSAQGTFLRNQVASTTQKCELVYGHHPAFSDGSHGDSWEGRALFNPAYRRGAELFLSGHDHNYQRFAPRTDTGAVSPSGLRQLVVGTGGRSLYAWRDRNRTESRKNTRDGALRLVLTSTGYTAKFIAVDGTVMDSFAGTCR
jgi:hypothetical protein